jgi:hypothetical protein
MIFKPTDNDPRTMRGLIVDELISRARSTPKEWTPEKGIRIDALLDFALELLQAEIVLPEDSIQTDDGIESVKSYITKDAHK